MHRLTMKTNVLPTFGKFSLLATGKKKQSVVAKNTQCTPVAMNMTSLSDRLNTFSLLLLLLLFMGVVMGQSIARCPGRDAACHRSVSGAER